MKYNRLGKTGLMVSEIGFGGEWLERHPEEHSIELIKYAEKQGINIIDCWMPDPKSRNIIGEAIKDSRDKWFVQGHFGSTWQDDQYVRTRDMSAVPAAFEDLLTRLQTDYIDLGMIHYVDQEEEWNQIQDSDFLKYIFEKKEQGVIKHIGISTHNPIIGKLAAQTDYIEMILFSINPAYDIVPAVDDLDILFQEEYDKDLAGIDPVRSEFYKLCEDNDIGLTVMKPFAGGRLFDAKRSPFGVAFTPVQLIHYALSKPATASVLCGYDTTEQINQALAYETASDEEKNFSELISNAPLHASSGLCTYCGHCKPCMVNLDIAMINKYYDLASIQPEIPATVRDHYMALEHHASECIGCQDCESRCPFGVPISERMAKAAALFGK